MTDNLTQIEIANGYRAGLIGTVTRHFSQNFYAHNGFGPAFEAKVARELADFVTRMESQKLGLWHAHQNDTVVGSIFIDGENLGNNIAHLRWFILDPATRGQGIGQKLMTLAMDFCDHHQFDATHLWTIKGTDAARTLYERHGFELAQEFEGDQWGTPAIEQKFIRPRK